MKIRWKEKEISAISMNLIITGRNRTNWDKLRGKNLSRRVCEIRKGIRKAWMCIWCREERLRIGRWWSIKENLCDNRNNWGENERKKSFKSNRRIKSRLICILSRLLCTMRLSLKRPFREDFRGLMVVDIRKVMIRWTIFMLKIRAWEQAKQLLTNQ